MDWHDLMKMKVTDLRDLAKEKTELTGVSGMHKEDLVDALAQSLGIEKPHKVVEVAGKSAIKKQIRALKETRAEALEKKDRELLHRTRHKIHLLRRKLRKQAHLTQ
jgi:hypothetical protein